MNEKDTVYNTNYKRSLDMEFEHKAYILYRLRKKKEILEMDLEIEKLNNELKEKDNKYDCKSDS